MNVDPIIVAMVSCVQMLDAAGPDEVDPSFAVKVQQIMGECLQEIPPSDEPELRTTLLRIADAFVESDSTVTEHLRRWAANLNRG